MTENDATADADAAGTAGTAEFCDQCGEPVREGHHAPCARARALNPPRYCPRCRRRMTVQVLPRGWTARCVEHGTLTS